MPLQLILKTILVFCLSLPINMASAEQPSANDTNPTYEVCFTPGQDCTSLIIKTLSKAKKSIYVQAYSFTSAIIAKALVAAKKRGVDVKIILDKSQIKKNKYSSATFFLNNHISTWVDDKPAIAHNKVMIIDKSVVITGSFNFTKAAQYKNAENVLIITNNSLAMKYLDNWLARQKQSKYMK